MLDAAVADAARGRRRPARARRWITPGSSCSPVLEVEVDGVDAVVVLDDHAVHDARRDGGPVAAGPAKRRACGRPRGRTRPTIAVGHGAHGTAPGEVRLVLVRLAAVRLPLLHARRSRRRSATLGAQVVRVERRSPGPVAQLPRAEHGADAPRRAAGGDRATRRRTRPACPSSVAADRQAHDARRERLGHVDATHEGPQARTGRPARRGPPTRPARARPCASPTSDAPSSPARACSPPRHWNWPIEERSTRWPSENGTTSSGPATPTPNGYGGRVLRRRLGRPRRTRDAALRVAVVGLARRARACERERRSAERPRVVNVRSARATSSGPSRNRPRAGRAGVSHPPSPAKKRFAAPELAAGRRPGWSDAQVHAVKCCSPIGGALSVAAAPSREPARAERRRRGRRALVRGAAAHAQQDEDDARPRKRLAWGAPGASCQMLPRGGDPRVLGILRPRWPTLLPSERRCRRPAAPARPPEGAGDPPGAAAPPPAGEHGPRAPSRRTTSPTRRARSGSRRSARPWPRCGRRCSRGRWGPWRSAGRRQRRGACARRAPKRIARRRDPGLVRVVNATGVVLHTNLGRAALPAGRARGRSRSTGAATSSSPPTARPASARRASGTSRRCCAA